MVLILKLCLLSSFYISAVDMSSEVLNVYFTSVDFHTILHWDAVCNEHPCTYTVIYKIYGEDEWINKPDCWGTKTFCNMTRETLQKEHVEDKMLAKVRVNSGNMTSRWKMSKPFTPIRDTNISAPGVSISSSAASIVLHINPPLPLYFSNYPEKRKEKKISFNITITYMSKLLGTYMTNQTEWTKTQLSSGRYCVTLEMKFEGKTSSSSPEECVDLNDLTTTEVILGSAIAIFISIVIAVTLAVYLTMYRNVLHPKAHLPSNLIFNDVKTKSSASDYKPDETLLTPSIFEGMEFCKHSVESDNNEDHPQNKRYVMTETWRKDYVNFRHKYTDPDHFLIKTVELRNSTYGTNALEDFLLDNVSISVSPDVRYTMAKESLHYGLICNEYDYYNNLTVCPEDFKNPSQPYFNQEEERHCFYVNDQFQAYGNISGNV